ncbi:manganese peroxidase [Mycena capillaripes]|nr:manganese peroxidase [Mycena capillaripes]
MIAGILLIVLDRVRCLQETHKNPGSKILPTVTLIMRLSALLTLPLIYITAISSSSTLAPRTTCDIWYKVLKDIQANLFDKGKCGDDAHDALRLSFHDAIGYSPNLKTQKVFGWISLDGSLIKFSDTELNYAANEGLESIVTAEKFYADKHKVGYGDMIQFAAAVSVGNCVGGPRIQFMAGRPEATEPAPDGLVPEAFASVTTILARVGDAGLTPEEMVDLLASHSVGVQEDVDPVIAGMPFDSTPGKLDTNFFTETMLPGTVWPGNGSHQGEVKSFSKHVFRLESDYRLSQDDRTTGHWQSLAGSQSLMVDRFATAMAKMALLGQNPAILTDCSDVIPVPSKPLQ